MPEASTTEETTTTTTVKNEETSASSPLTSAVPRHWALRAGIVLAQISVPVFAGLVGYKLGQKNGMKRARQQLEMAADDVASTAITNAAQTSRRSAAA